MVTHRTRQARREAEAAPAMDNRIARGTSVGSESRPLQTTQPHGTQRAPTRMAGCSGRGTAG
jgi:hypothetical protein